MSQGYGSWQRVLCVVAISLALPLHVHPSQAASFAIVYSFTGGSDGSAPGSGLITDDAGNYYGTTALGGVYCRIYHQGCGAVFRLASDGTESVIHAFTDVHKDGGVPEGGLISDNSGNLYGTTEFGGNKKICRKTGCGTVFKVSPNGQETVLYAFVGSNDGAGPIGAMISDKAGNLFGTTLYGGSTCECGTVFKIASNGAEFLLHVFIGGNDGALPRGGLIRDKAGNLYGTTMEGGNTGCNALGCGTVFKLAPDGTETLLHVFGVGSDGAIPWGGVIADQSGNLYGTTLDGGGTDCPYANGCGTVFELAPDGTETVLYRFVGGNDGANPNAPLLADHAGNLYGTTQLGGGGGAGCAYGDAGCGTVFKLAPDGTDTILHAFRGGNDDGNYPQSGLIADKLGNLYGTTNVGGSGDQCGTGEGCGTVFRVRK